MAHHKVRHFKGSVSEEKLRAAGIIKPVDTDPIKVDPVEKEIIRDLKEKLAQVVGSLEEFQAGEYAIWMTGNPDYAELIRRYRQQIDLLTAPEMDEIDVTPMGGW